jgi:hypothetical protein
MRVLSFAVASLSLIAVSVTRGPRRPGPMSVAPDTATWILVKADGKMDWPPNVPPVGLYNRGQPVCRLVTPSGPVIGQAPANLSRCIGSAPGATATSAWPPPFFVLAQTYDYRQVAPENVTGGALLRVPIGASDTAYVCKRVGYSGPFGIVRTQMNPFTCEMGRHLNAPGQPVIQHAGFRLLSFR